MLDVLIAGAGPAGAVAAIVLARAGARVLVLDRAYFPRHKLCGDTVNPGALAVLRRLGLESCALAGLPIDGMVVTAEPGVRVEGRYDGVQGRALARSQLDTSLVAAARLAGAQVEEGALVDAPLLAGTQAPSVAGVLVKRRSARAVRIPARIVIAADGRTSRITRALGLSCTPKYPRRWAVGAYFSDVAGLTSLGEMHVRRGHYLGVAPMPDGTANTCIVTTDRAALANPDRLLATAVLADPQLRDRFTAARLLGRAVSLGPLAVDCGPAGLRGLLLAGDACGFVDPMTGDGLRFAFRGGELAADEALHALEHGDAEAHTRLSRARAREFGRKWAFNRTLRALVGSAAAVRAAGWGAALAPRVLNDVISYAGDVQAA